MKTSRSDITDRQLTVRLPGPLYARAARAAKARHISVNALIRRLLEEMDRGERERELRGAYEQLGGKSGDVDPFFDAQAEVARRG